MNPQFNSFTIALMFFIGGILQSGTTMLYAKDNTIHGTIAIKGKVKSEYSSLAKVTLEEAIAYAVKSTSGKVIEAALDSKDGYLIYEIDVRMPDSTKKELVIDAGNGKTLLTKDKNRKSDDEDEDEEDEE